MGACPDHVESLNVFILVVRPKPCALRQPWLHSKGRALIGPEPRLKIEWGHDLRTADLGRKPWQHRLLKVGGNGLPVGLGGLRPVDIGIKMRHGRQNIKRVAALGRERGVGGRWPMQIQAEVFAKQLMLEDILQQPLVAGP